MSSLPTKTERSPKEEYESIPVFYCKQCHSLRIMRVAESDEMTYCDDCGSTSIGQTSMQEWEADYREKHGFNYLDK